MNCQQVNKYLYEYCDNILNPLQKAEIDQHLKHCLSCRLIVNEAMLEGTILREEWPCPALPEDFTAQIMYRIANTTKQETLAASASSSHKTRWKTKIIAVAAVILFAFYIPVIIDNQYSRIVKQDNSSTIYTNNADIYNNSEKILADRGLPAKNQSPLTEEKQQENGVSNTKKNNESPSTPAKVNSFTGDSSQKAAVNENKPLMEESIMMAETTANEDIITVQPANLPVSYVLLNQINGAGFSTFIYGKAAENKNITINISQLPLDQQIMTSKTEERTKEFQESEKAANENLIKSTPEMQINEPVSGSSSIPEEEGSKAESDLKDLKESNSIAYEFEYNGQKYLITINANLSSEELSILSHNLKLEEVSQD